jgi:hypothetical protein
MRFAREGWGKTPRSLPEIVALAVGSTALMRLETRGCEDMPPTY